MISLYPLARTILLPLVSRNLESVTGTEYLPATGFVLAPNHVDWLDGFYLAAAIERATGRRTKFLTASNNYRWTGVAVQIPEQSRGEILQYAVQELKAGTIVCNFPEGQRNDTEVMMPGKTGCVRMAMLAGVPIVPTGIIADPGRTFGTSVKMGMSGEHPVSIAFGRPMTIIPPPGELTHEWLESETRRLMAAIANLCRKRVY